MGPNFRCYKMLQMGSRCLSLLRLALPKGRLIRFCSGYSNSKQTHFGYQTVGEEQKKDKVLSVFHNVADTYDVMNDVMSVGIHRVWKNHFMNKLDPGPSTRLLDVAGGTGDIAFRFLDHVGKECGDGASVVVCDINKSMLEVGEERAKTLGYTSGVSWVEGDGQALPFPDNSFDCYTIAFGIRNVVRVEEALDDFYSFQVIPPMGKVIAGDWDSYQYLVESIRQFPDQETFAKMIRGANFRFVEFENLSFGVAAIHSGFKL